MKKILLIGLVIFTPLFSIANEINHQYQDKAGKNSCRIFHFKNNNGEVFELVSSPLYWRWGAKSFRAAEIFSENKVSIEYGDDKPICDATLNKEPKNTYHFTCSDNKEISFSVQFNDDKTIHSAIVKVEGKDYPCTVNIGPFNI